MADEAVNLIKQVVVLSQDCFTKEAQARAAKDPEEAERLEENGLGIIISHWTEWDGMKIMRVFRDALEDANFHSECLIVDAMMEAVANDKTLEVKITEVAGG